MVISFSFFSCSGTPQLSPKVCEVGTLICDISTNVCATFPIPEPVCSYVNLACINIALLCAEPVGSDNYNKAKLQLDNINTSLETWIEAYKLKYPERFDSTGKAIETK